MVVFASQRFAADSPAAAVDALLGALRLRCRDTWEHAHRVAALALELTRLVEPALALEARLEDAYLLHDIGKLGIPDAILLKQGPLDEAERVLRRVCAERRSRSRRGSSPWRTPMTR